LIFFTWTQEQAKQLLDNTPKGVNWLNIADEIQSLGFAYRCELEDRTQVLIRHFLKWNLHPEKICRGWYSAIRQWQREIQRMVKKSPSLKKLLEKKLPKLIRRAHRQDQVEMGLYQRPTKQFTLQQLLSENTLNPPWKQAGK